MRILIQAAAAKMGGAANYIRTLASELAECQEHDFIFLVPESQAGAIRGLAPNIRALATNVAERPLGQRLWFDQVELRRLLRRERIDVLFSTADFAAFFCPCRQVLLARNSLYYSSLYRERILPHKGLRTRVLEALRRWLARRSAGAADVVLAPSQAMLDELRLAVPVRAARVSHYGVDRRRFRPVPKPFAPEGSTRLLFTSLYSEHKNIGTLFRAALHLTASGHNCRLITTADPEWEKISNPIRHSERMLAAKLRQRNLLELTGVLAGSALDQLYARADIFVYPPVVESFGHPLLEAMAAGLPVVAADVPVNRELCGEAALYFSPFDANDCARHIGLLINDADYRGRLIQMGLLRVRQFSWASHVRTILRQFASSPDILVEPVESHA